MDETSEISITEQNPRERVTSNRSEQMFDVYHETEDIVNFNYDEVIFEAKYKVANIVMEN